MRPTIQLSTILCFLFAGSAAFSAQPLGTPGTAGRLVFIFMDQSHIVKIDDEKLERHNNATASVDLTHGPHLLQVYLLGDGRYDQLAMETMIYISGDWETSLTFKPEGLLITGSMPIKRGSGSAAAAQIPSTTIGTEPPMDPLSGTMAKVLPLNPSSSTTAPLPIPSTTMESTNGKSRLVFMSEQGMAEIYLDGMHKAQLELPGLDGMARATIDGVAPGVYLLKVTHSMDVWYEGQISVGRSEEIEVRIDDGVFQVLSRVPR